GVPLLNLTYLKDDDKKIKPAFYDLRDYSLDTPYSASTIRFGKLQSNRNATRPDGVPELRLEDARPESYRRPDKQQTVWDKDPVPVTVSQPSARYKQMYQQYSDEMKQSYRDHVNASKQDLNGEIEDSVQHQSDGMHSKNPTLQRYTDMKQLKKKDAEELLEKNKKLKLVETVMIDQMSRAVISDTEQNEFQANRHNSSQRSRVTNRHLHDS
ncbi:unnamed protein product, partial [Candidula unifasciata]